MFCVSDTCNKMKKCPKIIAGMYELKREWCVGVHVHVFLSSFLRVCVCVCVVWCFFLFFFCLIFSVLGSRCLSNFNVELKDCVVTYLALSWKTIPKECLDMCLLHLTQAPC